MSDALRKAAILPLLLGAGVPPAAAPLPAGLGAALVRAEDGAAEPLVLAPEAAEVHRIGPYRVLRALGSGGMGTVYLAESSSPPRRVALKVMREDRRGARFAARFAVERQALAAAEHDSVARLHDSGVTAEGQPWLALELVDGEPLLEHCDRLRLDVEARLRLFSTVCEAVQHLHERGILHRDLKPANILVSPQGVPKVIDLGLARLDGRLYGSGITDVAAAAEEDDCVMGTPAYMAPEQLTLPSHELDARCDVYSLGLILRDLLVGPRTLERGPLDAVLRTALDDRPPSASLAESGSRAASIARRRSTRVSSLRRRLRGPLDRITARAAAQRPDDRPGSAASLGAAVERDRARHEGRHRTRRSLVLAMVSGMVGVAGGFLAAHVLG